MSYAEKIAEARKVAFEISVNYQMTIEQLEKAYENDKIIYICHDGKIVDSVFEEDQDGKELQRSVCCS